MAKRQRAAVGAKGPGPGAARRVWMLAYPDAQTIAVTAPLEVFAGASRLAAQAGRPGYVTEIVALERGPLRMSSGLEVVAARALRELRGPVDTLLVAGGWGSRRARYDERLTGWLRRTTPRARRFGSVCTGAFLLAEAGLLEGCRVTTHWGACEELARAYPGLVVDPDPIYVREGRVWTSAGVTAGMDLALALVEEDHGRELALAVARWLVLFLKRPGGQSQFSAALASQLAEREAVRELQTFVVENPTADLSVEALARRSAMSPRNFARVFAREVGLTPARFVERARVEAARRRLEDSRDGVESIARASGFGSAETLRRACLRHLGVSPAAYRSRFRTLVPEDRSEGPETEEIAS